MTPRLLDAARWLCCLFVLHVPVRPVKALTVPPPEPYGIEAQAKFFQYRHLPTSEDFDQGHRQGSEQHFVERHEKSRPAKGLFSAKVRWGDKNGGYGEHYWDLNHAGYSDNHGDDYNDDDGSYHEEPSDVYNSPGNLNNYDAESYSDDTLPYEETGRIKRAHSRVIQKGENSDVYDEQPRRKQRIDTKYRNHREIYEENGQNDEQEEREPTVTPPKIKKERVVEEVTTSPQRNKDRQAEYSTERPQQGREKNHYVLVVNHKEREADISKQQQTAPNRLVSYEDGAGVRQHHKSEVLASASAPRLFLETQTGHIVDRITGKAYVLQPVVNTKHK